jgi:hypothetical protein
MRERVIFLGAEQRVGGSGIAGPLPLLHLSRSSRWRCRHVYAFRSVGQ